MKKLVFITVCLCFISCFAQQDSITKNLRVINNSGSVLFNIDGIDGSYQTVFMDFNEKNLKKLYRQTKVKKDDPKQTDTALNYPNYRTRQVDVQNDSLRFTIVRYFIDAPKNRVSIFTFNYIENENKPLEHELITMLLNKQVPEDCYTPVKGDSLIVAHTKIPTGDYCQWMSVNNLQCPGNGQMSWSFHPSMARAEQFLQTHMLATTTQKGSKIVKQEEVPVIFESVPLTATKMLVDFTGVKGLLASTSGGKNLTVYNIAGNVNGNYISCILSYWNNDTITETGLAPLLDMVLTLPKKD